MAERGGQNMTQSGNIIPFERGAANDDADTSLRQGSGETWRRLLEQQGFDDFAELPSAMNDGQPEPPQGQSSGADTKSESAGCRMNKAAHSL